MLQRQVINGFRAWVIALAVLTVVLLSTPSDAQTNITPSLIAETRTPAPGSNSSIAIHFVPGKEWHGYWKNPGDAGFPGRYEWTLPKGVTISAPRYPVPEKLIVSGLMNHVYQGEHTLIARMTLDKDVAPGTNLPLKLKADWLACTDKVCVPESGELALTLTAGDGAIAADDQARFDKWRAALARPLGSEGRFAVSGDRVRLAIPWPAGQSAKDGWFFAATEQFVGYKGPQSIQQQGNDLIIDMPKDQLATAMPNAFEGVLALPNGQGFEITAKPGAVAGAAGFAWGNLLTALGGALFGGILLNLMPCVFPVISLKALSLARAGGDEGAAKREAIAYSAGVVATCLLIGGLLLGLRAAGLAVGWAFQLQQPLVILFLTLLASAITLNLAGWFELGGLGHDGTLTEKGGSAGAFWTGALAAFVATPCTGPFMAAALGAALVLPLAAALAVFAGLGLGMAIPFLAIGFIPMLRNRMPKPGAWMATFQRWMAVPMALTTAALLWLLWRQTAMTGLLLGMASVAILAGILWTNRKRFLSPAILAIELAVLTGISWSILPAAAQKSAVSFPGAEPFSETRLAALRAQGSPAFVYFTADWCLTCKVNEQAAIEREETIAHFKDRKIAVLVGDWSRNDPAITRFLESQGRSGVPLYLFYPAKGEPQILPQILTPAMMGEL